MKNTERIFIVTMKEKFKELYRALAMKEAEVLIISHPEVLGDDYEEIVYNLNRISDSGKTLTIPPARDRNATH